MANPISDANQAARDFAAQRAAMPLPSPESAGFGPAIKFASAGVQPPSSLYVSIDDQIVITFTSLAVITSVPIILAARVLSADGQLHWYREAYTIAAVGVTSHTVNVSEGFILDVTVSCPGSGLGLGSVFVQVDLRRNNDSATYRALIADYLTNFLQPTWPGGTIRDATAGAGGNWQDTAAAPAPGAELVYTVPASLLFEPASLSFSLATSAAAANRIVSVIIDDGFGDVLYQTPSSGAVTASTTPTFSASVGVPFSGTPPAVIFPLPAGLRLTNPFRITTHTTAIQAADQYSAMQLFGQGWINAF